MGSGPGVSQVVQVKASCHLRFALGHPAGAIKESEMAATCAGLVDSPVKPSCESRLVAASVGSGAIWKVVWGPGAH